MNIVQVAAEFAPLAKAGGLGEVLLGLSRELTAQHHTVKVVIPRYSFINPDSLHNLRIEMADLKCIEKGQVVSNIVWSAIAEDCELRLIEARHPSGYFHRQAIYGEPDDTARFLYFSKVVLEYLKFQQEPVDILHLHDWHTAACALLLRDLFTGSIPIRKIVLTIHNLEYQGKCATWDLDAIGLNGKALLEPAHPDTVNLLKGGICYADATTTVSPTYAKESLTPTKGFGLETTLKRRKWHGILNGIDTKIWNPAFDPHLETRYDASDSLKTILAAKRSSKALLQKQLGVQCLDCPLVGAINRLVPQKGPELLEEAIHHVVRENGAFILLGSSPAPELKDQFDRLMALYKNHPRVFLQYVYDDRLAHQIYAALDFLVAPSLFEPCGLTQLIALRYGAIPIVHSTGGLKDTVFDCEDSQIPLRQRNGFVFQNPTREDLSHTLNRALSLLRTDPTTHHSMIRRSMLHDYSWREPTKKYLNLYRRLLS